MQWQRRQRKLLSLTSEIGWIVAALVCHALTSLRLLPHLRFRFSPSQH